MARVFDMDDMLLVVTIDKRGEVEVFCKQPKWWIALALRDMADSMDKQ